MQSSEKENLPADCDSHLVCSETESECSLTVSGSITRTRLYESDEELSEILSEPHTPVTTPKARKIEKTEDDAVPLPDPFPLPKHFRSDVEVALKNGKMTSETRSCFISAVASAMLRFKRYPTREDYTNVARTIIQKCSFFKSPTGTPHVS